jgi:predicted dehydrogenase
MITAGIAGLGWWGKNLVRSVQGDSAAISFSAGAVRYPDKVEGFAAEQGLTLFNSLDAMLVDAGIDAVVLATPHSLHAEQMLAAITAGKHVFCEKPFTMNKKNAERVIAAANAAGVMVAVGYNRRFHPAMTELRRRITDGTLGTPLLVEAMAAIPASLWMEADNWRFSRAEWPAGGLTPMGVHQIDHMVELFGPITSVTCHSINRVVAADIDDTTAVLVEFASGMNGFLSTLIAARADNRFAVYGSVASAEIRTRSYNRLEIAPLEGEPEIIDFGDYDMDVKTLKAELEAFADAAGGGAPFPVTQDQIVHVVAVTEAIIIAAETGQPVRVG